MVRLNTTFRVRSVHMESVEMGAYGFDRAEALRERTLSVSIMLQ